VVDKSISEAMKEQTGNRVGDKSQESEVNVDNLDLQLPTSIAHLYTEGLGHDVVDSQDHDQMVRWMKFLEEHEDEGDIAGTDLLKTMELVDENVLVGSIEKADQDYDSGASDREMLNVDDEQIELGKQILQSLERDEEEEELDGATTDTEDQEELDKEVV
jgi:hypothetical protein